MGGSSVSKGLEPPTAQNAMESPTARPKILKAIDEGRGEQGRRRVTNPPAFRSWLRLLIRSNEHGTIYAIFE